LSSSQKLYSVASVSDGLMTETCYRWLVWQPSRVEW